MVNAWSLAHSVLNGTLDEDYPIMTTDNLGVGEEIYEELLDPEEYKKYKDEKPWDPELAKARLEANSPYNDGWTQQYYQDIVDKKMGINKKAAKDEYPMHPMEKIDLESLPERESMAHYFKYHEEEILKDIEEYVSSTYRGHYTGDTHEYRNVQTLDLMAARSLASGFCQSNILKYGSRYGSKDGRNKKDLMKVIHYAMLLLHFDDHYGKPSMPSGNFEQMP